MKSATTAKFRQSFASLPAEVQRRARKAYQHWRENPRHPSLHFKKVGKVWSARVDDNYRVLAHVIGDTVYWFWIGSHAEYERLLCQYRKG
jgi:mRNA-degrading endonuclease RelE of RelBE toxin-antitoxin system